MAGTRVDVGMRFGRLVVTKRFNDDERKKCDAVCDCGKSGAFWRSNIGMGQTRSCGCLVPEVSGSLNLTHGRSKTKAHVAWCHMNRRCYAKTYIRYPNWGGRGITVCDRWRHSFENFLADMGEPPTPKHSLDRIDNDGPYAPQNCRWATLSEQARNKRSNLVVTAWGETKLVAEWLEDARCVVVRSALLYRLYDRNTPPELAMSTPSGRMPRAAQKVHQPVSVPI